MRASVDPGLLQSKARSVVTDRNTSKAPQRPAVSVVGAARLHEMVSQAAYFRAEHRGFSPGRELDDWFEAEREIAAQGCIASTHSSFVRELRERSLQLRSAIRDALLRADTEQYASLAGEVHDAEDDALADLLVDVNLAEITHDIEELRDTESALQRIAMGAFGRCVGCGESIAHGRLEAYPTAKRCVPCQQRYDQARAIAPPPSL